MPYAARRLVRPLLGLLAVGLIGPGAARAANSLSLTPTPASGVPTTVNASGSTSDTNGRVSVFREPGTACPATYITAAATGVALDSGHTITAAGSFSFDDDNSVGTQVAGSTHVLCGYLETMSATTVAGTAPYTVPGSPPPPPGTSAPAVVTGDPGGEAASGVTSNFLGKVTPNGLDTTYRFDYGTTAAYGQHVDGPGAISGNAFIPPGGSPVQAAVPFPAGTTFHYRLEATNADGPSYGADRIGTTGGGVPTTTTGAATDVTPDGFTLNGTYNPHGNAQASFEFTVLPLGTGADHGTTAMGSVPAAQAGSEQTISQTVPAAFDNYLENRWPGMGNFGGGPTFPGETPTLTIRYRLVVGETNGAWRTVTSRVASRPPAITTGGATLLHCADVGPCIKLAGTVNDEGQGYSLPAFEVGPTKSYGSVCPVFGGARQDTQGNRLPSSSTPHAVTRFYCAHLRSTAPGTTVHYRLLASNNGPAGVVKGADRTYTFPGGASVGTIVAALSKSLGVSGAAAKITAILKAGAYPAKVTAPSAGTASIAWYYVPKGAHVSRAKAKPKPVLVASGRKTFTKKGRATLRVKLSRKGRAMLKKVKKGHRLKLTAKGSFHPKGSRKTTSKKKAISLKR